jgi:undecaprenyl pyrophosphate phosphatase UppP
MSYHLTYAEAVITGLIQGVTELFPVSSLGHNVLLPALIGGSWAKTLDVSSDKSPYLAFVVGLHVATAIAMIVYFWRDWLRIIRGFVSSVRSRSASTPDEKLAWMIILATIPVGIVGAGLQKVFTHVFAKPTLAALFLALNGVILLYSERQKRRSAALAAGPASERPRSASRGGGHAVERGGRHGGGRDSGRRDGSPQQPPRGYPQQPPRGYPQQPPQGYQQQPQQQQWQGPRPGDDDWQYGAGAGQQYGQDPRYYRQDPRQQSQDPRQYPQDPREYRQDPRQYGQDPSQYGQDPRRNAQDPRRDAQDPRLDRDQRHQPQHGGGHPGHGVRLAEGAGEADRAVAADRRLSTMGYKRSILIGAFQIAALLPGISRDGIVTVAGLWRGLSREDAVRFSFLLSAPVILAAGALKAHDLTGPMSKGIHGPIIVGSLLSGIGAYLSIRFLTRYFSEERSLNPFGIYCLVAGIGSLAYLLLVK